MDTDSERTHIKWIATALLAIGSACWGLAGVAVNKLVQSGQVLPVWAILLLVIGALCFLAAFLLLLAHPKSWRELWQSVLGFPTWLRETYIWHKYGPKCTLEMPVIDFELYSDEQMRRYSANIFLTVFVSEKTSKYYPVRCSFRNITFQLEQKYGLVPLHASLELNPVQSLEILLNTSGKTTHKIGLSWFPCNNPAIVFVDLQKPYTWVIKDVHVYLDNLRKCRKLSKKGRVSNVEKTKPQ